LSWLTDEIGEGTEPPLTDHEFRELFSLWEQCRDHPFCGALPQLNRLPAADELERALESLLRGRNYLARFGEKADDPLARRLCRLGRGRLEELARIAQDSIRISVWLAKRTRPWIDRVRNEVLAGRARAWNSLESTTSKALEALADSSEVIDAELETPSGISRARLMADAADLLTHLDTGRGLGFWIFRATVVKRSAYLWRDTRLGGRHCDSPPVLRMLIEHLRAHDALDRAWQEWGTLIAVPDGTVRHRQACLEECRTVLRAILQLRKLVSDAEKLLGEVKGKLTSPSDTVWARDLLRSTQVAIALLDLGDSQQRLSGIVAKVLECRSLANPHPVVNDLAIAAEQGNVTDYRSQLQRLTDLHHERCLAERCLSLDRRLRDSAPLLAESIKSIETRSALAASLDSFGRAWAWKRAAAWLKRFSAESSGDIADELADTEIRLQEATRTLATLKAWKSCDEYLRKHPEIRQAMVAWAKMVEKIGKGTGKHAETYRRTARKYFQQARLGIPVFIMPLYRVAEQVEAEPETFDVVIVDESSQTGPEGLLLQYLGKQCVIVGDDKQISPEGAFIEGSQIQVLMDQYLDGIPFKETLHPAISLFDQAAVRYGDRITLREHFRCMPEIIRFSNELCYTDTPLIPLRQYPPSRLPPIQVRFVKDGYRVGKSQDAINRPEAAAVAKTVIDCLRDPRYKGKSFGVICLQGHAQAQTIEHLILEAIGPGPFKDEKTRLLCGDPYSFQGDERDIVFLSTVASVEGEGRSAPLTRETFKQRFNVAASRPRDQSWLFHSIREGDLHPECMRRRLLNFYYNPNARNVTLAGRGRDISKFQQDVGEALSRAGFRLISEYEVAGRFIDWVVEDRDRRLAIECDGDTWHGPDRYEADMARQRMLERCGWRFIRIRGSVFYANQSNAIDELIRAIRAHGLEPCTITEDQPVPRDWVQEISGNECMEALGAYTIDAAEETIIQQGDLFPEESEANSADTAGGAAPPAESWEMTVNEWKETCLRMLDQWDAKKEPSVEAEITRLGGWNCRLGVGAHKHRLKQALIDGRPVPDRVLADYPDLTR
jgi:very-short-patch-repair endonuclease